MSLAWLDENAAKILLLRLRRHRPILYVSIEGQLGQKRIRGADRTSEYVKRQISLATNQFGWKCLPRARVAVSISFFPESGTLPAIQNLSKFYLDLLKGLAFKDDRQIHYLATYCARSTRESPCGKDGSVIIKVQRMCDWMDLYKGYLEILDNFRHDIDDEYTDSPGNTDPPDTSWLSPDLLDRIGISQEAQLNMQRLYAAETQKHLLSSNKLREWDWPGVFSSPFLGDVLEQWNNLWPFVFEIEKAPERGKSNEYKHAIQECFVDFHKSLPRFGKLIDPVELDIQVRTRQNGLHKDLDNIFTDIASPFASSILENTSYIQSYRIYVTPIANDGKPIPLLRIKVLPVYNISEFEDHIEHCIAKGIEHLEEVV